MKILALGDLHGGMSARLLSKVKKEEADFVLCNGDIADITSLRKLIFKHWNALGSGKTLVDIIGKKRYDSLQRKSITSMEMPLRQLNSLGIPIVLIWGNADYVSERKKNPPYLNQRVKKYKNIRFVARERAISFEDVQVLAFSGYRFPGEKGFYKSKMKDPQFRKMISERNKKWEKRLKKLFLRRDKKATTIFLCHDPPRNCLDKVRNKESPMDGKNLGDEYYAQYLKKYAPTYCVCGHMHENAGRRKLGKTTVVNTGAAHDGEYAVITV